MAIDVELIKFYFILLEVVFDLPSKLMLHCCNDSIDMNFYNFEYNPLQN